MKPGGSNKRELAKQLHFERSEGDSGYIGESAFRFLDRTYELEKSSRKSRRENLEEKDFTELEDLMNKSGVGENEIA